MYRGTFTALVTPFTPDNQIDTEAYRRLVDYQFDNGVTGIVPVGTTGESPTLSHEEHKQVITLAVEYARGRGPVIAGAGSNNTVEAIDLTRHAEEAGCEAVLSVCPYYNKPSQEGLYQHFKAIARSTSCRIMLYSIPGRSSIEIGVDTTVRLAQDCPNIVSIKEAGGSVERVNELVAAVPEGFTVLSGDDSLTLAFMAVGAVGVVSVASNLIPRGLSDIVSAALREDYAAARATHRKYYRLMNTLMKLDTNPVPIKTALEIKGMLSGAVRLPMVGMTDEKRTALATVLQDFTQP